VPGHHCRENTIIRIKDNYFGQNGSVIMAIMLFSLVFAVIIAIMQ
jgi:hypothetical protein